jgi:hypothetical protein
MEDLWAEYREEAKAQERRKQHEEVVVAVMLKDSTRGRQADWRHEEQQVDRQHEEAPAQRVEKMQQRQEPQEAPLHQHILENCAVEHAEDMCRRGHRGLLSDHSETRNNVVSHLDDFKG